MKQLPPTSHLLCIWIKRCGKCRHEALPEPAQLHRGDSQHQDPSLGSDLYPPHLLGALTPSQEDVSRCMVQDGGSVSPCVFGRLPKSLPAAFLSSCSAPSQLPSAPCERKAHGWSLVQTRSYGHLLWPLSSESIHTRFRKLLSTCKTETYTSTSDPFKEAKGPY